MPNKLAGTVIYEIWRGMKRRSGVAVCSGLGSSFASFFEEMGDRPSPSHSIGLVDGGGHYSCGHCEECLLNGWPSNCRWAPRSEQRLNQKNVRFLEFRGERLCLKDMAEKYGKTKAQLHGRLKADWSLRDALLRPVRPWREGG